ncbi:MAG: hypothetical protein AAFV98_05115 [Chloroflexota bacterium]
MKRVFLLSIICLLGIVLMPVQAQDDFDCTAGGINRQIDTWYNDFLSDRSEVEAGTSLEAAATLQAQIDDLLTACEFATEEAEALEEIVQIGDGAQGNPFVIQAPGTVGDTTLTITLDVRPASDLLSEAGVSGVSTPPLGQEYVVIFVTAQCSQASSGGCIISDDAFRLVSDSGDGISYAPSVDQYDDYFPTSRSMIAGTERTGGIPFLVDESASDLRLVYYPEGNALDPAAQGFYYAAQGTTTDFEVTTTTSQLIVRNRPDSGGAPVAAFRSGQTGVAVGRTEDSAWIYVVVPEGDGWASAEFITSERDLESLQILTEDFVYEEE